MKSLTAGTPKSVAGGLRRYLSDRGAVPKGFSQNDLTHRAFIGNPVKKRSAMIGERIAILPRDVVAKALEMPMLSSLLPVAVGFSPNASGEIGEPITAPGQSLIIYSSRGRGWCEMSGRRHEVSLGELLVIPSGTSYFLGTEQECLWAISWVQLAGSNLAGFLGQLGVTGENPVVRIGDDPRPPALFQELLEVIESGCTPAHLLQSAKTLTRLFDLLNWQQRGHTQGEAEAAQKIRQSIGYMKERLDQPLQVSALAASVNISQSHYFALFKRLTGSTPIDYFIHLRMRQACHLLDTTSTSVKGVAAALGYDDQFYFSRVFRSVHGVAPSDYRLISSETGVLAAGCRKMPNQIETRTQMGYGVRNTPKTPTRGEDSP